MPACRAASSPRPTRRSSTPSTAATSTAYGESPHELAGLAYDGVAAVGALIAQAREPGRQPLLHRAPDPAGGLRRGQRRRSASAAMAGSSAISPSSRFAMARRSSPSGQRGRLTPSASEPEPPAPAAPAWRGLTPAPETILDVAATRAALEAAARAAPDRARDAAGGGRGAAPGPRRGARRHRRRHRRGPARGAPGDPRLCLAGRPDRQPDPRPGGGVAASAAQPHRVRADLRAGGRRLRPRRDGALLRRRPPLRHPLQADPLGGEPDRERALLPLGPAAQGRPVGPDHRRLPAPGARRRHHPHQPPRAPPPLGRRRGWPSGSARGSGASSSTRPGPSSSS